MPSVFATAGITSASGGGVFFGVGVTGETRLIETGKVTLDPAARMPADAPVVIVTPPMFVPGGRPAVLTNTVRVCPPAGTVPVVGETVIHEVVGIAVNASPASSGPR